MLPRLTRWVRVTRTAGVLHRPEHATFNRLWTPRTLRSKLDFYTTLSTSHLRASCDFAENCSTVACNAALPRHSVHHTFPHVSSHSQHATSTPRLANSISTQQSQLLVSALLVFSLAAAQVSNRAACPHVTRFFARRRTYPCTFDMSRFLHLSQSSCLPAPCPTSLN